MSYINRDTLAVWRRGAQWWRDNRVASRVAFEDGTDAADVILRLLDAAEAPCGSCHPCTEWAAETWRRSGGPLPHKHTVDEWQAIADRVRAAASDPMTPKGVQSYLANVLLAEVPA